MQNRSLVPGVDGLPNCGVYVADETTSSPLAGWQNNDPARAEGRLSSRVKRNTEERRGTNGKLRS